MEIIGEAARKIPKSFQEANTQLPWRRITATRHRLAHEYGDIDDQIIWKIATVHIPELVDMLKPLIQKMSEPNPSD